MYDPLDAKIRRFLSVIADNTSWNVTTEYGPYGSYYRIEWVGEEDLHYMAEEILQELEERDENFSDD
jgi:hypothetical protein